MEICKTIASIKDFVKEAKTSEKVIGLVPTMGALHHGHLKLIKESNQKCDLTIASIFVNPTQFNNPDDLAKYPRTLEDDLKKLREAGCDAVFLPESTEVYPSKPTLKINFEPLASELEGKFRPGHFDGVGLVVSKLFNIIQPHHAFFGQKDLQQFFIIKTLRDQLNFPIELTMVPTVREVNGLAMSSRNMRLGSEEKTEASLIYKALKKAQEGLIAGKELHDVTYEVKELFRMSNRLHLEYFEIVDTDTFQPLERIDDKEKTALCIAAEIGQVRLIDNLMLIS